MRVIGATTTHGEPSTHMPTTMIAFTFPGQGSQFRLTLPRRIGQPLRHSPIPLVPTDAEEKV